MIGTDDISPFYSDIALWAPAGSMCLVPMNERKKLKGCSITRNHRLGHTGAKWRGKVNPGLIQEKGLLYYRRGRM